MEIKDALRSIRRLEWPTLEERFCPEVQVALTEYVDAFLDRERMDEVLESYEYYAPQYGGAEPYWTELSHLRKMATAKLVGQLKAFRALNIAMYGDHPSLWEDDPTTTAEYSDYIDRDGDARD